jgi:LmbE family N-acetylglucosaminyl deacetylase
MARVVRAAPTREPECLYAGPALLVFAHADDETIALGARLHRLTITRLIHVTDGAPRDEHDSHEHGFSSLENYRKARLHEFQSMLAMAGAQQIRCENLRIPDQQATQQLAALTRRVAAAIQRDRPTVILTHPYEGGHPDHDASAFAVHHAVRLVSKPAPRILECAFYHAGPRGIETGVFLPGFAEETIVCPLNAEERNMKQERLGCYTTQRETLRYFRTDQESFRVAPRYDFSQPPHPGRLFYENFPWGMTAERFCQLAIQARHELVPESVFACP